MLGAWPAPGGWATSRARGPLRERAGHSTGVRVTPRAVRVTPRARGPLRERAGHSTARWPLRERAGHSAGRAGHCVSAGATPRDRCRSSRCAGRNGPRRGRDSRSRRQHPRRTSLDTCVSKTDMEEVCQVGVGGLARERMCGGWDVVDWAGGGPAACARRAVAAHDPHVPRADLACGVGQSEVVAKLGWTTGGLSAAARARADGHFAAQIVETCVSRVRPMAATSHVASADLARGTCLPQARPGRGTRLARLARRPRARRRALGGRLKTRVDGRWLAGYPTRAGGRPYRGADRRDVRVESSSSGGLTTHTSRAGRAGDQRSCEENSWGFAISTLGRDGDRPRAAARNGHVRIGARRDCRLTTRRVL